MTPSFELFYESHLAGVEGIHADDEHDAGGETWFGISSAFLATIGREGPITRGQAKDIAYQYFWDAAGCESMDPVAGWSYCDALFNHRSATAAKMLQHALDVKVDGVVGPKTREAAVAVNRRLFVARYRVFRTRYYWNLVQAKPEQAKFLVGWIDRVHRLNEAMLIAGLFEADLQTLPWYRRVGGETKINLATGGLFAGALAMLFPDVDLTAVDLNRWIPTIFTTDAAGWKSIIVAAVGRYLMRWIPR